MKKNVFKILYTLIFAGVLYYLMLPPINIQAPAFWVYIVFIIFFHLFIVVFDLKSISSSYHAPKINRIEKSYRNVVFLLPIIFILIVVINIVFSPMFNAKEYSNRITITEGKEFSKEVEKVNFDKVPLLDKDSTRKIGDRVMGEMTDLVSQFDVSNLYTQINYNNKILRVTPLEYLGVIKYFTNREKGITGYITVDSITGAANLVRLEKGMRYVPSAMFNENLYRKLRFNHPTEVFGEETFELDNEGNPYWVVPTISYKGIGLKREVSGVIILDPITGKSKKYSVAEVPEWVDHVYSAELILEQVNDWGMYRGGFINSLFGQKNVVATTEGYNYLIQGDDVFLYTGITSVANDESNLGFILTNMRTKETNYYLIPGAEEYSAMASAEGQVQQMQYVSTFPLLINLNNRATYLVSLKDNAGLVKMYAFIDVQDYQKVSVSESSKGIEYASKMYLENVKYSPDESKVQNREIVVRSLNQVLIDGNTTYFLVDNDNQKYKVSIKIDEKILPFIKVGDKLKISYLLEEEVIEIIKIGG